MVDDSGRHSEIKREIRGRSSPGFGLGRRCCLLHKKDNWELCGMMLSRIASRLLNEQTDSDAELGSTQTGKVPRGYGKRIFANRRMLYVTQRIEKTEPRHKRRPKAACSFGLVYRHKKVMNPLPEDS